MTRPQDPERLPSWLWLWVPLAVALALASVPHVLHWETYKAWFLSERFGVLETVQVLVVLIALFLALRTLAMPELRRRPWLLCWAGVAALSLVYVTGEEVSWGQTLFGWATPDGWSRINDQGETNLHNTSSWLDQKPRGLLEIGVILGGIVLPLAALVRPELRRQSRFGILVPPLLCLPSAVIAEFARASQRVVHLSAGDVHLFGRPSEVQELYFYLFVMLYLIVFRRRLSARHDAHSPGPTSSTATPKASSGAR